MEPHRKESGPHWVQWGMTEGSGEHAMVQGDKVQTRADDGSAEGGGGEGSRQVREAHLGGRTERRGCGKAPGSNSCFRGCGQTQLSELQTSTTPFATKPSSATPAPRGTPASLAGLELFEEWVWQ